MAIDSRNRALSTGSHRGWNLTLAGSLPLELRERIIPLVLDVADGSEGECWRRSLHAETWLMKVDDAEIFVKVIRPATGIGRFKQIFRGRAVDHLASISGRLIRDGFETPVPMLWGWERASGREVVVTARANGITLPRFLREQGRDLHRKRVVLRALGIEIARLHSAGFLHGDLTPYNILLNNAAGERFILLDNDRTRKTWLSRFTRPRLRNLVQLGRFAFAGLSRTDRIRVWRGYAGASGTKAELKRLLRMIENRNARDLCKIEAASDHVVAPRKMRET